MTIHAHEYKPRAVWRRKGRQDKSRLFLGFELEVEILEDENDPCDCCRKRDCHGCEKLYRDTPQGVARMLEERLGHRDPKGPFVYFKDDGSINCGFEMVSHPMTYGWIRSHRRLLKRALRLLRWRNADAASNCGLHVHVSRAALSQNTIDRMVDFVYDNPGFIERISRRDPDDLYEWAAVHLEEEYDDYVEDDGEVNIENAKNAIKRGRLGSRCVALNTSHKKTLEFRLFASTTDDAEFFQALEFAHAVATFCGKRVALKVRRFADWVKTHRGTYPNLARLLASTVARRWPGMSRTGAA